MTRPVPAYVRAYFEANPHASVAQASADLGKSRNLISGYRWRLRKLGMPIPCEPRRKPKRDIAPALEVLEGAASVKRAAAALGITPGALRSRIRRRGLYVEDVRGAWVVSSVRLTEMLGYKPGTAYHVTRRLRKAGAPIKHVTYYRRLIDLTEFVGWAATEAGRKSIDMARIADQELREAIEQERAL